MKKAALKEAIFDTIIAMLINVPLNYFLLSIAFHQQWKPFTTTILLTTTFTTIAILRKTVIRIHFHKKQY